MRGDTFMVYILVTLVIKQKYGNTLLLGTFPLEPKDGFVLLPFNKLKKVTCIVAGAVQRRILSSTRCHML